MTTRLWLRSDIFDCCLVPLPKSCVLNCELIAKLSRSFCTKQEQKGNTANVKFAYWEKIGKRYLQYSDTALQLIFDGIRLLTADETPVRPSEPAADKENADPSSMPTKKSSKSNKAPGQEPQQPHSGEPHANFYQLMLFVMLHLYPSWSGGSSRNLKDSGESPESMERRRRLEFVRAHLFTMLHIVSPMGDVNARKFTRAQFDLLSLLFAGGPSYDTQFASLSRAAPLWQASSDATFTVPEIADWIRNNLTHNPLLATSPPEASAAARVVSAAAPGPPGLSCPVLRPCVLEGLTSETRVLTDDDAGCDVAGELRIVGCHKAHLYVLACVRTVVVERCTSCTVFVGAACRGVAVRGCRHVQFVMACKGIRVTASEDCDFNLICTTSPVVIGGGCRRLRFGPYHSHYAQLDSHLQRASIRCSADANRWSRVLCTPSEAATDVSSADLLAGGSRQQEQQQQQQQQQASWSTISPQDFMPFAVPFRLRQQPGDNVAVTKENPAELPPEYAKALLEKMAKFNEIRDIMASHDDPVVRKAVEQKFEAWLKSAGKLGQLEDLMNLAKRAEGLLAGGTASGASGKT